MAVLRMKPDQDKLKAFMLDEGVTIVDVLDAVLDLKNLNGDQLNELAADLKNYIANWKGAK